ncbi:MAG TPA: alpha/beta hydrolase [Stellaceae bacterium]|nr:alpha/beta hydrolase [Stellaceae bacterium]
MDEERRFVAVFGHRLEYRFVPARRAAMPVLVFLHQGLGSVSMWRDVPERLAECTGCAALVYSRQGHGWSDPAAAPHRPEFMLVEGRTVLPELLARLGCDDVILVGHSDGGTIALAYLAAGHRARGAIVVAAHVRDEAITRDAIAAQRRNWDEGTLRRRLQRHHRDVDALFHAWAEIWLSPEFHSWSIAPLLSRIAVPLLVMQGHDDSHGTMVQVDEIARRAPGPVEVAKLENCGHDPFRDRPDIALALCAAFIARLTPTP